MKRECCFTQVIKHIIKRHLWDLNVWSHMLELCRVQKACDVTFILFYFFRKCDAPAGEQPDLPSNMTLDVIQVGI